MNKRIAVALLVCFLLTGCSVDTMAYSLANDIAGQVERMYADGQSPAAPAFDGEMATPTVSTAELAEQARQAYERLKEENREDPMVRPWEPLAELAQIRDMNGDGIPELILATFVNITAYEAAGFQWEGQEIYDGFEGPVYIYSVYTYGESGLQTLISQRPTLGIVAAGCDLVIGADQVDGQPVVVVLSSNEDTGINFGEEEYTRCIHVEAVNPFTGQCLDKLDQEIQGSRAIDCSGGSISERVGHYTYLTLDENGILTFPQVQAATPSAVWGG